MFKVGDRVYSRKYKQFGYVKYDDLNSVYKIGVKFDDNCTLASYTKEGCFWVFNTMADLKHAKDVQF